MAADMSAFDAAKAIREELAGLADVEKAVRDRERTCEEAISKAEAELNAIRKIRGFVRIQIEQLRADLAAAEQAK